MIEALILLFELVSALLLIFAVKNSEQDKSQSNLGLFSYRESAMALPDAQQKKMGKTDA